MNNRDHFIINPFNKSSGLQKINRGIHKNQLLKISRAYTKTRVVTLRISPTNCKGCLKLRKQLLINIEKAYYRFINASNNKENRHNCTSDLGTTVTLDFETEK